MEGSVLFDVDVRDVGEADAHGSGVAGVVDAAEIDDAAAVAGAEFVECGVKAPVFLFIEGSHGIGDGFEQGGGVIMVFAEVGESDADFEEWAVRFGAVFPQAVEQVHEAEGGIAFAGADFGGP